MSKKYDVIALGELLVDFTESGTSEQGNGLLEACPGGAPCNVLAFLNKMGRSTAFIGKVGEDQFGKLLRATLDEVGIDHSNLIVDKDVRTTLAFVHTYPDGDREFSFYRNPGADMMLSEAEIDEDFIAGASIFHFGTLSMTHDGVRAATKKAVAAAKKAGLLISFDPNLREPLWDKLENAREQMLWGCSVCDVLKISDNEIQFISGKEDYDEGIAWLRDKYNIPLICLTLGKDGSRAYMGDKRVEEPGFSCKTIETTGAGDTFCGGVLNFLLSKMEKPSAEDMVKVLDEADLAQMLTGANAGAAIVTTRKGAIKSMPSPQELADFRKAAGRE